MLNLTNNLTKIDPLIDPLLPQQIHDKVMEVIANELYAIIVIACIGYILLFFLRTIEDKFPDKGLSYVRTILISLFVLIATIAMRLVLLKFEYGG